MLSCPSALNSSCRRPEYNHAGGPLTPWDVALGVNLLPVVPTLAFYYGWRMERSACTALASHYIWMIARGALMAGASACPWRAPAKGQEQKILR
jgi:hypothetical protein